MFNVKRREFITLLGGAAAAWPLAARSQAPERVRRIVFLHSLAEADPEVQARIAAFRQGLFGPTETLAIVPWLLVFFINGAISSRSLAARQPRGRSRHARNSRPACGASAC